MVWEGDEMRGVWMVHHTPQHTVQGQQLDWHSCHTTTTKTHNMMAAVQCRCGVCHTHHCVGKVGVCLVVHAAATLELCPKARGK